MKKYCSLILTLCLAAALAGCGITTLPTPEDPEPPAAADPEEITYEVTTDPHEETVHAEDGTLLMTVSFQLPHLQAYADGTLIEHFGRRCQGWFEDDEGHREQCDFRFRFKNCPQCNAENDIAARRCRECDTVLVDPDDMLKAALKLKDALVLRCSGMALQPGADEKGEWLKITYYDEDGADVSERFRVQTPAQRTAFEQLFIRPHTRTPGVPLRWITVADIVRQQVLLRHPDFVVARKKGQYWQVREKLFDYEGRFRRANELRG